MLKTMNQEEPMDYTDEGNGKSRNKICLQYRGKAIIVTFEKFDSKLDCDDINLAPDKSLLENAFKKLQYGVVVWDDIMDSKKFFQRLKQVSQDPLHMECETFALVIISHGGENGRIYAYEKDFSRQEVIDIFNAENCPALNNKLKLFIFHACCGNKHGVAASGFQKVMPPIVKLEKFIEKDNLILCSTTEGTFAYGSRGNKGSYFVNALKDVIYSEWSKAENQRKHILALLTDVIRKTASEEILYLEEKDNIKRLQTARQQPVMVMALNQLYYFEEKSVIPEK